MVKDILIVAFVGKCLTAKILWWLNLPLKQLRLLRFTAYTVHIRHAHVTTITYVLLLANTNNCEVTVYIHSSTNVSFKFCEYHMHIAENIGKFSCSDYLYWGGKVLLNGLMMANGY